MYHPSLGRWLQPDPTWPQDDVNTYGYLHNNPINELDPMGLAVLLQPRRPPRPGKGESGDERAYRHDNECDYYMVSGHTPPRWFPITRKYCSDYKVQCCDKPVTTMDQLCGIIDDLLKKKSKVCRLTIAGHGCAPVGVWLQDPEKSIVIVFTLDTISDDCAKKIKELLASDGVLRLCGCGTIQTEDEVKKQLKDLYDKLGVVVCACVGETFVHPQAGCGCVGKWVCHPPK